MGGARAPRLQLQQLQQRAEGWRVLSRAGVGARREGEKATGRGGRLCQANRRGALRSPALLPGARMQTLELVLLG